MTRIHPSLRAAAASLTSLVLGSAWAFAQNSTGQSGGTTTTTTTSTDTIWYSQWWIWAVGIAVFLIIVIALTNRGGRSTP